jgi:hypothetical protein
MHSNRRRFLNGLIALTAVFTVTAPALAQPRSIGGETFEATAKVADAPLVLNGVGVRGVAIFNAYAAGLYLTAKAPTPAQLLATPGAKRLQIRMLIDVPAKEFVKAIDVGIERNTPPEQHALLAERQAKFAALVNAVGTVKKGDAVNLDFVPDRGLIFSLNGKPQGEAIPGDDLYGAVLKIFVGEKPVDKRLKAGLLGGS